MNFRYSIQWHHEAFIVSRPLFSHVMQYVNLYFFSVAQFTNADSITRVTIAAEFFLKLHPPLLFDVESIPDIEAITRECLHFPATCSMEYLSNL